MTVSVCVQCVVKEDKATGGRVVAGTHWDFDSYGGTIKKQLGMPTQARSSDSVISKQLTVCACMLEDAIERENRQTITERLGVPGHARTLAVHQM